MSEYRKASDETVIGKGMSAVSELMHGSRRKTLIGLGALGATATLPRASLAQTRRRVELAFWMFENPQQRPWVQKRVRQFVERNPHVTVDFQAFTFSDLGKKLSVGFATGTAPDGFLTGDWLMPTWLARNLVAPMDVERLGFRNVAAFSEDHPKAFVDGAVVDGKVYGYPLWFYGFVNYINTNHFREVGLDPVKDAPQSWEQVGEVARRLAVKDGNRFVRQGYKFAMHAPLWTMIHFNPILSECGGSFFDAAGRCTVNNAAGLRAMNIRSSIAKKYGAEDPADSIATQPLPSMDWLKERNSMFVCHPLPLIAIRSQNQKMFDERYFRAARAPGVEAGRGTTTSYGFNFVISSRASGEKQEILHDLYKFVLEDKEDCWADTQPFPLARKSGWADSPAVRSYPDIEEILAARDQGILHPRTPVFNELADAMHRAVQRVMLNNVDPQVALDAAAAEVDRATAGAARL